MHYEFIEELSEQDVYTMYNDVIEYGDSVSNWWCCTTCGYRFMEDFGENSHCLFAGGYGNWGNPTMSCNECASYQRALLSDNAKKVCSDLRWMIQWDSQLSTNSWGGCKGNFDAWKN